MKLLNGLGAVVSIVLVAVGFLGIGKFGLDGAGLTVLIAASGAALALSLTLYVFHLRGRIVALENGAREQSK